MTIVTARLHREDDQILVDIEALHAHTFGYTLEQAVANGIEAAQVALDQDDVSLDFEFEGVRYGRLAPVA